MITVLTVVFIVIVIVGLILFLYFGDSEYIGVIGGVCSLISLFVFIGLFITDMVFVGKINTITVVDSQIEIVQEENEKLEEQICSAVEHYLKHEGDIFQSLDITTAIGLYSAYPNLKSNELVQSLIETYQANTSEIKALKLKKTEVSKYKWLVYFGH